MLYLKITAEHWTPLEVSTTNCVWLSAFLQTFSKWQGFQLRTHMMMTSPGNLFCMTHGPCMKPRVRCTEIERVSFWWNFHHWLHWKLSTSSAATDENFIKMTTFPFQLWVFNLEEWIQYISWNMHKFCCAFVVVVLPVSSRFMGFRCITDTGNPEGCGWNQPVSNYIHVFIGMYYVWSSEWKNKI